MSSFTSQPRSKLRSDEIDENALKHSLHEKDHGRRGRSDRAWRHDRYDQGDGDIGAGRAERRRTPGNSVFDRLGNSSGEKRIRSRHARDEADGIESSRWRHDKYSANDRELDRDRSRGRVGRSSSGQPERVLENRGVSISGSYKTAKIYEEKRALFVENFERDTTESDLTDLFDQVGPVESVLMGTDINGRLLCNAEVVYRNPVDAKDAVHYIPELAYGSKFGNKLMISYSSPEKNEAIVESKYKSSLPEPKILSINERLGL